MSNEAKPENYRIETYIIAAFGLLLANMSAEEVKGLVRREDFSQIFRAEYNIILSNNVLESCLDLMSSLNLLVIDRDEFAGAYVTVQKTAFMSQFKEVGQQLTGSALAISLRAGRPWIGKVFENKSFWEKLENSVDEEVDEELRLPHSDRDIPASDRSVTLLHNSPERIQIEEGLEKVSDALRTDNEIGDALGDDRERISAEVEGVKTVLRSEKVRLGYIKDSILKVLRELGGKLKEKAIDLGIDKLIALFEAIMDHYL